MRLYGLAADIEDSVVIFDEAHNIEDVARDVASLEIDYETLMAMSTALSRALKYNMKPEVYDPLLTFVTKFKDWMQVGEENLKKARL